MASAKRVGRDGYLHGRRYYPIYGGWLQGVVGRKRWERCGVLENAMVGDSETERVLNKGIWEDGEMRQQSRAPAAHAGDLCSIPSKVAHNGPIN